MTSSSYHGCGEMIISDVRIQNIGWTEQLPWNQNKPKTKMTQEHQMISTRCAFVAEHTGTTGNKVTAFTTILNDRFAAIEDG